MMRTGCEAHEGQRDVVALDDAREHALHLHHVLQLVVLRPHERKGACTEFRYPRSACCQKTAVDMQHVK